MTWIFITVLPSRLASAWSESDLDARPAPVVLFIH